MCWTSSYRGLGAGRGEEVASRGLSEQQAIILYRGMSNWLFAQVKMCARMEGGWGVSMYKAVEWLGVLYLDRYTSDPVLSEVKCCVCLPAVLLWWMLGEGQGGGGGVPGTLNGGGGGGGVPGILNAGWLYALADWMVPMAGLRVHHSLRSLPLILSPRVHVLCVLEAGFVLASVELLLECWTCQLSSQLLRQRQG